MGVLKAKVNGVWQDIGGGGGSLADPGDVKATCAAVAPAGWLLFGATYPGADVAYPDLWAVAPAGWKVGTDLVLPSAADCTLLGGTAVGTIVGSNSKALAAANMPAHTHPMAHTHTINHTHPKHTIDTGAAQATSVSATHVHAVDQDNVVNGTGGIYLRGVATQYTGTAYMAFTGAHIHACTWAINIPAYTGNTGASSAANSGNAGSATALALTRKHVRVNWIVKT